ncbi:hypothetical protein [Polaromonas sp.]|uniref:hypothetical protein n=1 Tax=Polaromonas sp. TaxID=1869339 RepID=UPI003751E976
MTLIVARQVDGDVYIVGDTKFSDAANSEKEQYIGGLKIVLLTPGLCVGFAGDVLAAREAIQGIYDQDINLFDKNLVLEYFLEHHRKSHPGSADETTFIVAVICEIDEQPGKHVTEIFRVANSKVSWEDQTSHIGESDAFNLFQKVSHTGITKSEVPVFEFSKTGSKPRPNFDASLTNTLRAMQAVIDDPATLRVDGYRTVVISEDGQFKYIEYIQIKGQVIPLGAQPGAPISFGGAPEGSDIKHVGMLTAVGIGILPVYSITGRFGLIYRPEISFEPMRCKNCSPDEFRLQIELQLSIAHERALAYQSRY